MVDKTNLEELKKTEIYGLTLLDDDHILDVEKISDNFVKLEKVLGNRGDLDPSRDSTIVGSIKKNKEILGDIDGINIEAYSESVNGSKTVSNFIKFLWYKVSHIDIPEIPKIELIDTKVKVTTWANKMLDVVLKELKDKDTEIVNTMNEYKASVDEYSTHLGIYVDRHDKANTKLEKLLKGDEAVDNL